MAHSEKTPLEETPKVPQHDRGQVAAVHGPSPFPVVGIGASAGGLESFRRLLTHLRPDTGMAFVLVQHLDPNHESRLANLLGNMTSMPVREAGHGMKIKPNEVYVIPPNANLAVADGVLHLTPRGDAPRPHLPVDYLFRSLAESRKDRAIGMVLSGTGSDGTLGLCEIKAVGGITFAEEELSAKHAGMPHSAIESGCVDFVLMPEQIGQRLAEIAGHPYLAPQPAEEKPEAETESKEWDDQFKRVLGIVRTVAGVDFSFYRDTTIKRRIMRRMAVHTLESLTDYVQRLEGDRAEVMALYHDLLINVTSFFRDAEVFKVIKTKVFPELAKGKTPTTPVRMWVPGCSTGQEAYSLTIAFVEYCDDKPFRPPLQIFATDLSDQKALEKARAGVYPDSIEAEVTPERLRRFFRKEDHVYRIDKSIRDACVFARHNVAADPPFSHVDLISCRNVLIYLATPLQKRVLPTLHYALNVPGYLVLGTAETVGENGDLFELADRTNKIYVKKAAANRPPLHFSTEDIKGLLTASDRRAGPPGPMPLDYHREADRILLGRYAPPGVLVNGALDILQFRGRTSAYLEQPSGEPTNNLLKMAKEGLFLELRNALAEAQKLGQPVQRENVRLRGDGGGRVLRLEVIPVRPPGTNETCLLVLFHETLPADGATSTNGDVVANAVAAADPPLTTEREVDSLRQELAATKEYLQSLLEQQDAINEELRSSNEEVLSSNEELQSTNEELETAKEELQSSNEELTTVNEQLYHRNLELSQVNNDLTNLLSSTNIPVIMVGGDQRIRLFTPPAKKVMNLVPTDVGRPVSDIKMMVEINDLEALITEVIETVQPKEREVRDRHGRWYELRIFPYRTADRKIDGAVIVLLEVDHLKRAEENLREADRRKDEFLATLAHELRNPLAPIRNVVEILRLAGGEPNMLLQARDVLDRQVRLLSRLVGDLIDVSRIAEKKISLSKERVSLASLVDTALDACRSQLIARRQTLSVSLPTETLFLEVDPERIAQVFINLLNNAAKFTESGGQISLSAERQAGGGKGTGDQVIVKVTDTGIGIASDLMPRIFDMFIQGKSASDASRSGLGIGLSLVRSLVQMHEGNVEARSAGAGKGSEFIVRLPLAPGRALPRITPQAAETAVMPQRILVVDDNQDQADSLGVLLRHMGHEVALAYDGVRALALAIELVPDLILLDLGLPGMTGYEVARRIREQPELSKTILVAQTGWGQDEDRKRTEDAGFNFHFVKPMSMESLQEVLAAAQRAKT